MRRKFWLPAASLLAIGLLVYFFSFAYRFTGALLCAVALVVAVFGGVDALQSRFPRASRWARRVLLALLAAVLALGTATGVRIGIAAGGAKETAQYVVVLGAGVNGTEPSQSLRERLEAALAYAEAQPDAILILSGGQGSHEDISEAECMYRWLTAHGVDPARLRREDKASSTEENIRFSLDLIEREFGERPETLGVVSAEYHLLRASLLAQREGVTTLCYPARTENPLFFCNMFVREICGVWYTLLSGLF